MVCMLTGFFLDCNQTLIWEMTLFLKDPKVWGPAVRVPPSPSFRFLGQFWPRPGLLLALGDGVGVGIGSERVGRSGCGPRGYFLLH